MHGMSKDVRTSPMKSPQPTVVSRAQTPRLLHLRPSFPNESTVRRTVRALGTWGLAASIVNLTIGGGIFRLPAAAAGALGAAAPVAYLVCALAMGLIVLCFAEAGSRVSLTGGLYAYVEVAFGPLVGFLTGVMLWAGLTAATAAVASFFADALGVLIPSLAAGAARGNDFYVVILGSLAALNFAGVRGASRFNAVMTVAKLLPLIALVVVGVSAIHRENLAWTTAPATGDVAARVGCIDLRVPRRRIARSFRAVR